MRCSAILVLSVFLLVGIAALVPSSAFAEWESNGTGVCINASEQDYPSIAAASSDAYIIAWRDFRNTGAEYDIYAQMVTETGDTVWQQDGVRVSGKTGWESNPFAVADGSGGAIITWPYIHDGNWDIHAQRIDSLGDLVWADTAVAVCRDPSKQESPQAIADGSGGAFFTWSDVGRARVYVQKVDASGAVLFGQAGLRVCDLENGQARSQIAAGETSDAIVTWMEARGTENIYAQRIDSLGNRLWGVNGAVVCDESGSQDNPAIAPDGAGGAIIAWHSLDGSYYNIHAQKLDSLGNRQWGTAGVAICTASQDQDSPQVVPDGSGGAIIVWNDDRNGNLKDIYVQRIDSSGTVRWQVNGIEIAVFSSINGVQIVADGSGGAVLTWHYPPTDNRDIYAQRVISDGSLLWGSGGTAICGDGNEQFFPRLAADGAGGAVVSWYDDRNGNKDIYAQRIHANGMLGNICDPGWPALTGSSVTSSPVAEDLDGSGNHEIIVGSNDGYVYVFNSDGSCFGAWPQYAGGEIHSSPSVGDIDDDGEPEIIVGSTNDSVYAWNVDGTPVTGWPKATQNDVISSPALGDIDGDGLLEVVVGSRDMKVHAWNGDGSIASGWPQDVYGEIHNPSPALGDIDCDGELDVVIGSNAGAVHAWHGDGTIFPNWPRTTDSLIVASAALCDLDNDGALEIVVGSWDGSVYAWNADGSDVAGLWPVSIGGRNDASPAIGDVDGNGTLDVVIGAVDANSVYAWDNMGNLLPDWPVAMPDLVISSAALADIDGDSLPEIIVGCYDNKVYALNGDGTAVPGWPRSTGALVSSSPAVWDIDSDDSVEVIVGSADGYLYVWELGAGTHNPSCMPWPMHRQDAKRTGNFHGPYPHTIRVPDDYPTIQAGVNAAICGDTVLVACGTYTWPSEGTGNDDGLIRMKSGVHLRSGSGDPSCVTIDCTDSGRVFFCRDVDSTATIEGFTVYRGTATGSGIGMQYGGGLFCRTSSLNITNCVFIDNTGSHSGGGICCDSSSITVTGCSFADNHGGHGGGIFCHRGGASLTLTDCSFRGNTGTSGGGLCFAATAGISAITDCVFSGNKAADGGGMTGDGDFLEVVGCTFSGNRATGAGGGIDVRLSPFILENTIVWGNCASGDGDQVHVFTGASITFGCCDLDTTGVGGDGLADWSSPVNIFTDPLFCDSEPCDSAPTLAGDYRLLPGSPCVDAPGCGRIGACAVCPGCIVHHVPSEYPTIQAGVDAANPCDTVLVADGTYTWTSEGTGDGNGLIRMKSGVYLKSATGDTGCVTIDAESMGRVFYCDNLDSTTCIEGFTIMGGFVTGSSPDSGGAGMWCHWSSPRLRNIKFAGNTAISSGGGLCCCDSSSATLHNVVFLDNEAEQGGGMMCYNFSHPLLTDCAFSGNLATFGGGLYMDWYCSAVLSDIDFWDNDALGYGGGMAGVHWSTPYLTGVTFRNNSAIHRGGGYGCDHTSQVQMVNCTFDENSAPEGSGISVQNNSSVAAAKSIIAFGDSGEAVSCDGTSDASLTCCDVYGSSGGDWVDCIAGQVGANCNFSLDPRFCRLPVDSLYLHATSPCAPGNRPAPCDTCGLIGAKPVGCYTGTQYVAEWGSDLNGDGTQVNPYRTIQMGVDRSYDGDTVCVAAGVYAGAVEIAGFDTLSILSTCRCDWGTGMAVIDTVGPMAAVSFDSVGPGVVFRGFVVTDGTYGISIHDADPEISNCIVHRNENGIELVDSDPLLDNCTVADNTGFGIYLSGASQPILNGNIITGNTFGIYGVTSCSLTAGFNDLVDNTIDDGGACAGQWPSDGNISADPAFADQAGADYHLSIDSPCIDTGDPAPSKYDPDGSRGDMGAYGGSYACQDYPSYVKALRAYGETTKVHLEWDANEAGESVDQYIVYRDTVFPFDPGPPPIHYGDPSDTVFTDVVGLNEMYAYRIAAVDSIDGKAYQGGYSVPIFVETDVLRDGVLEPSYYWGCGGQTYIKGNVTAAGVGLKTTGSGSIVLTSIPVEASILKALLYWEGTAHISLDGERVGATKIGTDDGLSSYRADVGHLVDGDDTYSVSIDDSSYGASLVVVYEDSTMSQRAIMINDGLDNEGRGSGGGDFDKTYFPRDIQDSAYVCYILGGGTPGLSEWYVYNGQVIAADGADAGEGASWDTDWIEIPVYAIAPEPGEVKSSTYVEELTDSLNWVVAINVGLLLPAGVSDPEQTEEYSWALRPIRPNPAGSSPSVAFDVPRDGGRVALKVYSVNGKLVATLLDEHIEAGRHFAAWDLANDQGGRTSPGVYFIRMDTGGFTATRKLVILE